MKLHELSADVERAVTLTSDLIKALRARHPFQLAYQGVNDRALQQIYGDMIGRFPGTTCITARPPASQSAWALSAAFSIGTRIGRSH